jgi:hypothetical protein
MAGGPPFDKGVPMYVRVENKPKTQPSELDTNLNYTNTDVIKNMEEVSDLSDFF